MNFWIAVLAVAVAEIALFVLKVFINAFFDYRREYKKWKETTYSNMEKPIKENRDYHIESRLDAIEKNIDALFVTCARIENEVSDDESDWWGENSEIKMDRDTDGDKL